MTGRFQSFASLGLLSLLTAGFGLWSAFSGPQIAGVKLQTAAADTLAASGFVETFQFTPIAAKSSAPATTIDYQAPDRFVTVGSYEVNGSKVPTELRMTQIGSECWEEPAAENPSAPSAESGCAPSGNLSVLQDLVHTSNVTLRDGVYTLGQEDRPQFVSDVYGPFAKYFRAQTVEVRTDGTYVTWLHIVLDIESGRLGGHPSESVVIGFTDVGTAPAVVRPGPEPGPTATTVAPTTASTNAGTPTPVPPTTSLAPTPSTLGG